MAHFATIKGPQKRSNKEVLMAIFIFNGDALAAFPTPSVEHKDLAGGLFIGGQIVN